MDDREIVTRCLDGVAGADAELVRTYGPLVLAVALNVLGNREDAEDVFQETFVQVFRHLERYDAGRSLKTWLLTIVYRRALDMTRKRRRFADFARRARTEPSALTRDPAPGPGSGAPRELPSRLLAGLSPKERTALCLWANEGYTAREISDVLGCSAATARVTLFNARRKVKAQLENDHGLLQNC